MFKVRTRIRHDVYSSDFMITTDFQSLILLHVVVLFYDFEILELLLFDLR